MIFYISVIVPVKINKILIYHFEKKIDIGSLVEIKILNKTYLGLVENCSKIKPLFNTKPILNILQNNCYSEAFIKTIKWISEYYFCPIGIVLKNFLPFSKLQIIENKYAQNEIIKNEQEIKKTLVVFGKNRFQFYNFFISKILNQSGIILILIPNNEYLDKIFSFLKSFEKYLLILKFDDTKKKKNEHWNKVFNNNDPLIIVGTKIIFSLPLKKVNLLIVEEEQDDLFQQEQNLPYYNAKNIFLYFAKLFNAQIILGTNCPSLLTFHNTEKKKI